MQLVYRPNHPPGLETGRILQEFAAQANHSIRRISLDPHDSIHALRTTMKKVRALVRLCAPGLPPAICSRIETCVDILKDTYADARDEEIIRRTFFSLCQPDEVSCAEDLFVPQKRPPKSASKTVQSAGGELAALIRQIPFEEIHGELLRKQLRKSFRKCRRRYRLCRKEGAETQFHDFRKAAKALAAKLGTLPRLAPASAKPCKQALKLGVVLGDMNDLFNLRQRLLDRNDNELQPMLAKIEETLEGLQQKALRKGKKLVRTLKEFQKEYLDGIFQE